MLEVLLLFLGAFQVGVPFALYLWSQWREPWHMGGPIRLAALFALLNGLSQFWLAAVPGAVQRTIFDFINGTYGKMELVLEYYFFSLISVVILFIFAFMGVQKGTLISASLTGFLRAMPNQMRRRRPSFVAGALLLALGIVTYYYLIAKLGGISKIWSNLGGRANQQAGMVYFVSLAKTSAHLGTLFLAIYFAQKRRWMSMAGILIVGVLLAMSLGARGPVIELLFAFFVLFNFLVRPIKRLVSLRFLIIVAATLAFMLASIQLRQGSAENIRHINLGQMVEDFEFHVVRRITDVERGVVVLGYFQNHDYWGLNNYYSVAVAPIPRGLLPDKPPVDTGRYLASIAWGWEVSPPVSTDYLASTSWPDRLLAGYMSFGIIGYFLLSAFSGFFYGAIFRAARATNFSLISLYLFAQVSLFGIMPLSPVNIVQFLTSVLLISFIGLLFGAMNFFLKGRAV